MNLHLLLFRRERAWTRRLVAAFPESAFDWRPAPDAVSCGELVRHMIQAERFWRRLLTDAVAGSKWDPFGLEGNVRDRMETFRPRNFALAQKAGELTSFAACLDHWRRVQEETEVAFAAFTAEQLEGVVVDHPISRLSGTLAEMLHYVLSHESHHRGQLSAYAKMLGIAQPPVIVALDGSDEEPTARPVAAPALVVQP
jgi:uncharacterized damage-inducible protein DinB